MPCPSSNMSLAVDEHGPQTFAAGPGVFPRMMGGRLLWQLTPGGSAGYKLEQGMMPFAKPRTIDGAPPARVGIWTMLASVFIVKGSAWGSHPPGTPLLIGEPLAVLLNKRDGYRLFCHFRTSLSQGGQSSKYWPPWRIATPTCRRLLDKW
jgi:hypothetical protein